MARRRRRRPRGMGCVYQRTPGSWQIKWREKGRVRYAHGFATRELAERVLAKIVADIATGRAGLPADPKGVPTLGELSKDWLERRKATHRSGSKNAGMWTRHLAPYFAGCRPGEVDAAGIRRFVEEKLAAGLNANTVGHAVRLLSVFFSDLVERGLATTHPVRTLPRPTRRLYRPTTDPRSTPFLESLSDVRRVFLALPEPTNVAFAVGAFAGLRTGEVLGLQWDDIDLAGRRIHVRRQVQHGKFATLKDDESRVVPIMKPLAPVLAAWKLRSGGTGVVVPLLHPRGGRPGSPPTFVRPSTLHAHFKKALKACELSGVNWYQATRHTFASQWVLGGGTIEKLSIVMGHSSVLVTERYAHHRPDLFRDADLNVLDVDLAAREAPVVPVAQAAAKREGGAVGCTAVAIPQRRRQSMTRK